MLFLTYIAIAVSIGISSAFIVLALKLAQSDHFSYKSNMEVSGTVKNAVEGKLALELSDYDSHRHCGIAVDEKLNDIVQLSCLSSESVENVIS